MPEREATARVRPRLVAFALLALLSLGFVQLTRVGLVSVLPYPVGGPQSVPGRWTLANVGTVLAAGLLFLLVADGRGLWGRRSGARWLPVAVLLVGMGAVALLGNLFPVDVYRYRPRTVEAALAFALFAPVAEEFLFRGAIYDLTEDLWSRRLGPLSMAVWVSSALFALSHFQYHGFLVTRSSLEQVAYIFPAGLVLGYARQESGVIWPAVAGHVLINLPPTIWGLWVLPGILWERVPVGR